MLIYFLESCASTPSSAIEFPISVLFSLQTWKRSIHIQGLLDFYRWCKDREHSTKWCDKLIFFLVKTIRLSISLKAGIRRRAKSPKGWRPTERSPSQARAWVYDTYVCLPGLDTRLVMPMTSRDSNTNIRFNRTISWPVEGLLNRFRTCHGKRKEGGGISVHHNCSYYYHNYAMFISHSRKHEHERYPPYITIGQWILFHWPDSSCEHAFHFAK